MVIQKEKIIKNAVAGLMALLLLLSAAFVMKAWAGGHFSSKDTFRSYLASYGYLGPLILCMIQALQVVLPVLPGFLGCFVGANMFGVLGGFLINYIGISTGSILAYWLAKRFGKELVQRMVPVEKYERWAKRISESRRYTFMLFLAILLPLAPDDFLCYFSGLTSVSARKFTMIILLGKPWYILLYSVLFAYLV